MIITRIEKDHYWIEINDNLKLTSNVSNHKEVNQRWRQVLKDFKRVILDGHEAYEPDPILTLLSFTLTDFDKWVLIENKDDEGLIY